MFQICLKNEHFSNIDYRPTSLTHKIENKNGKRYAQLQ